MSALRKMEMYEAVGSEAAAPKKSAGWLPVVIVTERESAIAMPAEVKGKSAARNIALFLAAPFIGLVYLLAMPVVALAALAWIGAKALAKKVPTTKTVAIGIAAPFIGLAAVIAAPFIGLGALAWVGMRSLAAR